MARGEERTPLVVQGKGNHTNSATKRALVAKILGGLVLLVVAAYLLHTKLASSGSSSSHSGSTSTGGEDLGVYCGYAPNTAGYIDLANKEDDHYFYWLFESRNDSDKDPLVMWLTGGPGGSSMLALLLENGPCTVNADLSTKVNRYSWNNNANMIWLDQPTGVGFSYGTNNDKDYNETNVGENIYWFMQGFLKQHPQFQGREFYITGESYGGHYVPAAAHYIWEKNKLKKNASSDEKKNDEDLEINLQGFAVGNGLTNPLVQYAYYQDMADNAYDVPLLTDEQVKQMKEDSVECIELTRGCQNSKPINVTLCTEAPECWGEKLITPFLAANRNNYDIRKECNFSSPSLAKNGGMCYDMSAITRYLNSAAVRRYISVDFDHVPQWMAISEEVDRTFVTDGDWSMGFHEYVADMLNDGLRVLIYAGDADLMCNWIGNRAWTLELEWEGKSGFNDADERPFKTLDVFDTNAAEVNAGVVRSYENFAFVRVYNAGHMVPMDQPAVALELINKFLTGEEY